LREHGYDDGETEPIQGILRKGTAQRLRFLFWLLGITFLLAATSSLVILFGIGKWLVREDPLQPATAIAVLSGNIPARALEAAELYHRGYAKEIWLTHPGAHADALRALGISYPSEDDFNIRVLRRRGVPAKAIHVLDSPIENTDEELDAISTALKSKGGQKVIIVTNKAHTRRVHLLWTKYFAPRGTAIVHGVSDDAFEAGQWWRTPNDLTQVVHEVLGIMNAWADLPVRPRPLASDAVLAEGSDTNTSKHASAD
jgi:uncharacterized SAM-binding protein YcdF (DUF218 family)